jgi:hypothetical protein
LTSALSDSLVEQGKRHRNSHTASNDFCDSDGLTNDHLTVDLIWRFQDLAGEKRGFLPRRASSQLWAVARVFFGKGRAG